MHEKLKLGTALALVALCLACADDEPDLVIPDVLLGRWVSDHEAYRDRYFEITNAYIAFYMGEGEIRYYAHRAIERQPTPTGTRYTLHYQRRPGINWLKFSFYVNKGDIRPVNQPGVVWKKETR